MRSKSLHCLVLTLLVTVPVGIARGQNSTNDQKHEQTAFDAEPDSGAMHINKAEEIPDSALQVLRDSLSRGPVNCLKSRGITPDQVPASWFLASTVHLNGTDQIDFIVLLNAPALARPENPGGCLLPANGGPFWVLGPGIGSGRYGLLLAIYGHHLEVLNSRTNGYRDIQIGSMGITARTTAIYKFTVQQYQLAEKKTEPQDSK